MLSSSILNRAWQQNTFKQGDLEYTSSLNQDFPFNKEPDFIQFESIRDLWKYDDSFNLTLDNEIRFENNEELSFRIKKWAEIHTRRIHPIIFEESYNQILNKSFKELSI